MSEDRTRSSWSAMMSRCYSPKASGYDNYGGRGILVCERWHTYGNFLADMGIRPPSTSIDRIDNNRGYEPNNCRWADPTTQARNKRDTILLTFKGETRPLIEWGELLGISRGTLVKRIATGQSADEALAGPAARGYRTRERQYSGKLPRGVRKKLGRNRLGPPKVYYETKIQYEGRRIWLGRYVTIDEAAHAVNKAAIALRGPLAVLNPVGADPRA